MNLNVVDKKSKQIKITPPLEIQLKNYLANKADKMITLLFS